MRNAKAMKFAVVVGLALLASTVTLTAVANTRRPAMSSPSRSLTQPVAVVDADGDVSRALFSWHRAYAAALTGTAAAKPRRTTSS